MKRVSISALMYLALSCTVMFCQDGVTHKNKMNNTVSIARQSLRDIRRVEHVDINGGTDIYVGVSRGKSDQWRVIIFEEGGRKVWDSAFLIKDSYFNVIGLQGISVDKDDASYSVRIEGCAEHQCPDKIGYAVYSSITRRSYVAHVGKNTEGKFTVQYLSSVPDDIKGEFEEWMCTEASISNGKLLPFKCTVSE